ncbi:MAG: CPBP family glutamic-type intramembrane protease [Synechococcales bacterium]|nr:CPBP family glutamic-type intramembrane protease [Synechococcales bacterium]
MKSRSFLLLHRLRHRLQHRLLAGFCTLPSRKAWQVSIALLGLYGLIFLPIGLGVGFLHWQPVGGWEVAIWVAIGTFFMPGLAEEVLFRLLLLPHPTEPIGPLRRRNYIFASWLLFLLYHLLPGTPAFFQTPGFLLGAGLLGITCTTSYLHSRSIWTAIFLHWVIVLIWLLGFGGLARFSG